MSSPNANATADVDCQVASEAWVQANADSYVWTKLPKARVRSRRDGASGVTTYPVPALNEFMGDVGGLMPWSAGNDTPPVQAIEESTVTITVKDRATPKMRSLPLRIEGQHRLAKIQKQFVPGELGVMYQAIESELVTLLQSAAFTSKTWSGTGTLQSNNSNDHTPLDDLRGSLLPYLKYRSNPLVDLVMIVDQRVLFVLSGYTDFTGAGTGSAVVSGIPEAALIDHIKTLLGINEIYVLRNATDSVASGQASSLTDIGGGILWCGLIAKGGEYDLSTYNDMGPDGALAIAMSRDPEVVSWDDEGKEVRYYHGRTEYSVFNPRDAGNTSDVRFGFYYPSSENLD